MQWWKSIPLHHKILGGLILGALFGALFNISKYELEVRHRVDGTTCPRAATCGTLAGG